MTSCLLHLVPLTKGVNHSISTLIGCRNGSLLVPSLFNFVGTTRSYNNPYHKINWVKNRFWGRVFWYAQKGVRKKEHKENHSLVQTRFKVTRWGIQRLSSKRNNYWARLHANHNRLTRLQNIHYVSRDDLPRIRKQLGGVNFSFLMGTQTSRTRPDNNHRPSNERNNMTDQTAIQHTESGVESNIQSGHSSYGATIARLLQAGNSQLYFEDRLRLITRPVTDSAVRVRERSSSFNYASARRSKCRNSSEGSIYQQPANIDSNQPIQTEAPPTQKVTEPVTTPNDNQFSYRWYSWPADDDLRPPTLKSESVGEMFNTDNDDDEDQIDEDLIELSNCLFYDEIEKRNQRIQGIEGMNIPEWCSYRSHEIPLREALDEQIENKEDELVPCAFNWSHGGHNIYLTGSFDAWSVDRKLKLARSGHEFSAIKELPRAVHYYKFIVDDQWKFSPNQATHTDEHGNVNNVLDLTDYQVYNFNIAKDHEQAREATFHQFVPGSGDYTTDAPVIPTLLSKSNCVAAEPPTRLSTPLHALSNHLYHDSHAAHLFGPHISSVTSTQRWRHYHAAPLSTAGLRFSTLIYVTFNPLFLLHGDANFELYAATPLRSLVSCRNSRLSESANNTSATQKLKLSHGTNSDSNSEDGCLEQV